MKFAALLPVRDEADIVGQCLEHVLQWADAIYVFDTGSVDNTWEIVQDLASCDKRILPIRKEPVYFSEPHLRSYMFHVARQNMHSGDWFLRVDADEFHHIAPPEFVKNCMRKHETAAYHQYYDFRLLQSEVDAWNAGEETLKDRQRPIQDRRRHYTVSEYSEPRRAVIAKRCSGRSRFRFHLMPVMLRARDCRSGIIRIAIRSSLNAVAGRAMHDDRQRKPCELVAARIASLGRT